MTAAQKVLSIPELRAQILAWIEASDGGRWIDPVLTAKRMEEDPDLSPDDAECWYYPNGVLVRCAQVNSDWWRDVIPLLWEEYDDRWPTPADLFDNIAPERRQLYANHIRKAALDLLEQGEVRQVARKCMRDVVFPNLKSLQLRVGGYNKLGDSDIELPIFHAPRLVSLDIDPRFEINPDTYGVFQEEWPKPLDLITVCFHPCAGMRQC